MSVIEETIPLCSRNHRKNKDLNNPIHNLATEPFNNPRHLQDNHSNIPDHPPRIIRSKIIS